MPQEILLTTSSSPDSSILLHDLHTSNHIQSFRQSTTAQNGLTISPQNTQFLAAQIDKGIVHVYSWGKDAINQKMILPEKIRSLQLSPSGIWCAGGSESGRLFFWEVTLFIPLLMVVDGEWKFVVCEGSALSAFNADLFFAG
jgi:pre-rRNA-processing protein IPI3